MRAGFSSGAMSRIKAAGFTTIVLAIFLLAGIFALSGVDSFRIRMRSPAPDFQLLDTSNRAQSLGSFRGSEVILYFGYAQCKLVCAPAAFRMKRLLSDPDLGNAKAVFVNIDPEESLSHLRALEDGSDHRFVVLRGDEKAIQSLATRYSGFAGYRTKEGEIEHSGFAYLIDPDGRLAFIYPEMNAAQIREDILRLRAEHERVL